MEAASQMGGKETGTIMAIENCNLHERNSWQLKLLAIFFRSICMSLNCFSLRQNFCWDVDWLMHEMVDSVCANVCLFKYSGFFSVCVPIQSCIVGTNSKLGFCRSRIDRSNPNMYIFCSSWSANDSIIAHSVCACAVPWFSEWKMILLNPKWNTENSKREEKATLF